MNDMANMDSTMDCVMNVEANTVTMAVVAMLLTNAYSGPNHNPIKDKTKKECNNDMTIAPMDSHPRL